jgi:hypothetical protein
MLSLKRSFFWSAAALIAFIFADWCAPWRDCFNVQNSCKDWKLREISSKQNRTSSNLQTVQKPYRMAYFAAAPCCQGTRKWKFDAIFEAIVLLIGCSSNHSYLRRLMCSMTRLLFDVQSSCNDWQLREILSKQILELHVDFVLVSPLSTINCCSVRWK